MGHRTCWASGSILRYRYRFEWVSQRLPPRIPLFPIAKSKQTTIQHFIGSEALQFVLGARQRVVQARHPSTVFYWPRKRPSSEAANSLN